MKKVIFLAVISAFTVSFDSHAQLGIQAGVVGVPGESFPTADGLDKAGGALGYTFGLYYNAPLGNSFVLQPAVNLVNKQWKDDLDGIEITKMQINYLEVPVQFVYTGGKSRGFFIGAGPSLIFGLSGKRTEEINGVTNTTDYKFGEEGGEGAFTLAVNGMAGYSFGRIMLCVNYAHGLTNQASEDQDFGNASHFALRAGFNFGGK